MSEEKPGQVLIWIRNKSGEMDYDPRVSCHDVNFTRVNYHWRFDRREMRYTTHVTTLKLLSIRFLK